jgi:hypothetical protein
LSAAGNGVVFDLKGDDPRRRSDLHVGGADATVELLECHGLAHVGSAPGVRPVERTLAMFSATMQAQDWASSGTGDALATSADRSLWSSRC